MPSFIVYLLAISTVCFGSMISQVKSVWACILLILLTAFCLLSLVCGVVTIAVPIFLTSI